MMTERHASDGELVAILDGEIEAASAVAAHVDTCAGCSARLSLVWHRAARLSEALDATAVAPIDLERLRPRPEQLAAARRRARTRHIWLRPGLRAAAGILLIAGVAAASPARGWILERVTAWRAEPAPTPRSAPVSSAAPRPAPGQGPVVWFAAEADELVVRFAVQPAGGSLTLVAGDDPRSSAQVVAGSTNEAFLVLPTELRVRNEPTSAAHYQVTLSPVVRRVQVRLGDGARGEIARVDVTPGMRRVIPIGSAGSSR